MSLRPIKAMNMAGVVPADLTGAVKPTFVWVSPTLLLVDETYQRALAEKSVNLVRNKIVATWDWGKFQPPTVVRTSAGLVVIDGQHTAIGAASHPEVDTIPVKVVHAPGLIDQAGVYIGLNRDRIAMTSMQMHHAAVVAGIPEAVQVQRVAEAAGVRILRAPPGNAAYKPRDTVSIEAIRKVIKVRGEEQAVQLLKVLADANLAPIGQAHVRAADALLFDSEFDSVKGPAVTSALISLGFLADQEAKLFLATHPAVKHYWRALASVILRRVNDGRRRRVA